MMMVIVVIGIAALLVSALNSSELNNARNNTTTRALAQAKDALIGRAASDANMPGSLPCPDVSGDGVSDWNGSNCTSNIGRLPWKTLGLTDIRDGSAEQLWYTLSSNFVDTASSKPLNSESNGLLNVTSGTQTQSNVIAIVFSPGDPVPGQDRSNTATSTGCAIPPLATPTNNLCVTNYLEGSNAANQPNLNFQASATGIAFNDKLLLITRDQLFPSVEMRIAREAKNCLDDYATTNAGKYPWAADTTDTSFYYSKSNTLFGRLPKHQTPDSDVQGMVNALSALQTAVTNCANGIGNQATLVSTGANLDNTASNVKDNQPTSPAIPTTVTNPLRTAGDLAKDANVTCSDINANPTGNSIQTNLNTALSALNGLPSSLGWSVSCPITIVSSPNNYWVDWTNQVFYQVDNRYRPGGTAGTPNISINGSGNYRATILVARKPINGQVRLPSNATTYLEGGNQHSNPNPNTTFTSNSISDSNYSSNNDLVLCLDGNNTCQ